ncbi:hypothetical protein Bca101_088065 [Brassica carinata]
MCPPEKKELNPPIADHGAVEKDSLPVESAASEIPAANSPPLAPSPRPVTSIEKDSSQLNTAASEIPAGGGGQVQNREDRVEPPIAEHGAVEKVENREERVEPLISEHGAVEKGTSPVQNDASEILGGKSPSVDPVTKAVTSIEKAAERTHSSSSHNGSTDDVVTSTVDGEGKRDIIEADTEVNAPVRRVSTRKRQNPDKYTPGETKKKGTTKRKVASASVVNVVPAEKVQKINPSGGPTTKPKAEGLMLVGGFNPFIPSTSSKRSAFLKSMEVAKCRASQSVADVAVLQLLDVFNCNGVCDPKSVDRVVQFMINRRDNIPSSRFDFEPSCFFTELSRHFPAFEGFKDKHEFSFSKSIRALFIERPRWVVDVDLVYSPLLISKREWVGMIVDFPNWAIYVVASNRASPTDSRVNDVIRQISIMLPHLLHRYSYTNRAMDLEFAPMPISRLDMPFLLEQPDLAAVGALLLLEFHAVGKADSDSILTAENVQIAAENYAIETLAMIQSFSKDQ